MNKQTLSRSLLAVSLVGALGVGASAWAADAGDMFKQMDANDDGRISAQEHVAGAAAMFAKMDANKDGAVAGDEKMPMHGRMAGMHGKDAMHGPGHRMMMMDANKDGTITATEHAAAASAMFAKMDANKDGKLTGAELQGGHDGMRGHGKDAKHVKHGKDGAAMAGHHDMPGHGAAHAGKGHEGMAHGDMAKGGMKHDMKGAMPHQKMMAMMDANNDGRITSAEHAAGAAAMFAKIDANRDGFVTRAEFDAGMKAMGGPAKK